MLIEFMLPEALVIASVVLPVVLHILQSARGSAAKDGANVCVLAVLIAELLIGPVAVIRPA